MKPFPSVKFRTEASNFLLCRPIVFSDSRQIGVEVIVVGREFDVEHGICEDHGVCPVAEGFAEVGFDYIPFLCDISVYGCE